MSLKSDASPDLVVGISATPVSMHKRALSMTLSRALTSFCKFVTCSNKFSRHSSRSRRFCSNSVSRGRMDPTRGCVIDWKVEVRSVETTVSLSEPIASRTPGKSWATSERVGIKVGSKC